MLSDRPFLLVSAMSDFGCDILISVAFLFLAAARYTFSVAARFAKMSFIMKRVAFILDGGSLRRFCFIFSVAARFVELLFIHPWK